MSASLLQKSLKLTEASKGSRKKDLKRKQLKDLKWRNISNNLKESDKSLYEENIIAKLKKLEELSTPVSVDVSQKIFSRKLKVELSSSISKEEEKTVFTDKDFEDFEKEYFAS